MSPEEQEIVDRRADEVARILAPTQEQKQARKKRSDAGKPKAKKAEAVPGVLSEQQIDELTKLILEMCAADIDLRKAEERATEAHINLSTHLHSLKGTA